MGCVRNYQLLPSLFRGNSCFHCFLLTSYLDPLLIFFYFSTYLRCPKPRGSSLHSLRGLLSSTSSCLEHHALTRPLYLPGLVDLCVVSVVFQSLLL